MNLVDFDRAPSSGLSFSFFVNYAKSLPGGRNSDEVAVFQISSVSVSVFISGKLFEIRARR